MKIFLLIIKMLCEEHAVTADADVNVIQRVLNQQGRKAPQDLLQALGL